MQFNLLVLGLVACTAFSTFASPQPISPERLVQRVSLKLRGKSPTTAETSAFVTVVTTHPGAFAESYEDLVDGYLESDEFVAVAEQMHSAWWNVAPQESAKLIGYIIKNDRPYFEYLDRPYAFLDGESALKYRQAGIRLDEPLPELKGDWRPVRLSSEETRFRSILSNLDFLDRFPDTATNRNRARASHTLRIFMCETIAPDSQAPPEPAPTGDPHGSDAKCIGCHYRLDPLARFFDQWRPPYPGAPHAWYDPSQRAEGKLMVIRQDGTRGSFSGTTETDLARFLKTEPGVRQCLARRVWEYAYGPGVALDTQSSHLLVDAINSTDNFKAIVKATLLHKYFWSVEEPPPLMFQDVAAAFQVCAGCHSASAGYPRFDPKNYPFATDPATNVALLRRIWGSISHQDGFSPMPKPPISALPAEVLAKIRQWVALGGYTNALQQTLDENAIKEVLNEQ